jgi:uracil-DNA glycosylase
MSFSTPARQRRVTLQIVEEIDESWSIVDIVQRRPPSSWEKVFEDAYPELKDVSDILQEQELKYGSFYPLKKDIFRALELTPLHAVRILIIGQDPYFQTLPDGLPRAQGLSFSVRRDDAIPSSLKNIYRELVGSIKGFVPPSHGDLREWAYQGVLLLNMCLTVRAGQPGSHGDIWMGFIVKVLKALDEIRPRCIYILLGQQAQKLRKYIGDKAIVLTASHPSGLSADRGFIGSGIFRQCNEELVKLGEEPINWSLSN